MYLFLLVLHPLVVCLCSGSMDNPPPTSFVRPDMLVLIVEIRKAYLFLPPSNADSASLVSARGFQLCLSLREEDVVFFLF